MVNADQIRDALNALQSAIHETAAKKGWWDDHTNLKKLIEKHGNGFNLEPEIADVLFKTSKSMLAVTEIAEGVEAVRQGDPPDDKCPEFSGQTVEIADDIIRQLDLAARFNLPVVDAIIAKMKFNESRSHMHGGKKI